MIRAFLEFWRRYRHKKRKTRTSFDIDQFEGMLNHSPVPGITLLVLVWAICALFLILAVNRRNETRWQIGERSPVTLAARCDFAYEDLEATSEKRVASRKKATLYFQIDPQRSQKISDNFVEFLDAVEARSNGKGVENVSDSRRAANLATVDMIKFIAPRRELFQARAQNVINRGILSDTLRQRFGNPYRPVKIRDRNGNTNVDLIPLGNCPDLRTALEEIFLNKEKEELCSEFCQLITPLFGDNGNLFPDETAIADAEKAAENVVPVMRQVKKGDPLVERGGVITADLKAKLDAENRNLPRNFEYNILIINAVCGLALLAIVLIYLVVLRPQIVRQPREMAVAAIIIACSLWFNYLAITHFGDLHLLPQLVVCAVPMILPMALLAVTLGLRTAFCCGFLTATVTTLMITSAGQSQLSLAVRWLFIGGVGALVVHRVVSYRSFFVWVFFSSIVLNAFFNLDILYYAENWGYTELRQTAVLIVVVGFLSAVIALVMVFVLELLFNLDTNMALTVLANLNHPLLERLKRQAPGTMFHSITVATLAEDAAIAIGANALRAKVGALFHDVGKLGMPQYFTENNRDDNKHLFLSPRISSLIIRDHVKKGLELARQYRLFRYVRDAIATHHGDDLVQYFYNKALKKQRESGEPESRVLESEFRYDGTPPNLKELTIICLADACEAACRSLSNPSEPRIRETVDKIITSRLHGGQLRNAELTLAELAVVRNCFIKTLLNINHGRIAYNIEEKHESTNDGVEGSPSAETGK